MDIEIIDEAHLATFASKAEANIHRIVSITKLKLGLLPYYWDYLDWVKSQILENERVAKETGVNQIANYLDVFHYSFDKWLKHTRVNNMRAQTVHPTKAISHSDEFGYVEKELLDSMNRDLSPVIEIPDFIKNLGDV